jgi:uncharacterized membrane protein (UPF0136 family)
MTGLILAYALLVAVGGIVGYVKARSQQSLISGLISGVALAIAWYFSQQNPTAGFALATFLALGLLIVFGLRYRKTGKFMPAGLMAILSLIAMVIFAVNWLT